MRGIASVVEKLLSFSRKTCVVELLLGFAPVLFLVMKTAHVFFVLDINSTLPLFDTAPTNR